MGAPQSAAEDEQLTLRAFAAADAGDYERMMAFFGERSVWDVSPWGLGTHTGAPAIRSFFGDWIGGFEEYSVEIEELTGLGHGVVLVKAVQRARSARMQVVLELHQVSVFCWEEGIAAHVVHYRDIETARATAERAVAAARARQAAATATARSS